MEHYTITLDTGTTNTRAILWDSSRNIVATENRSVGVRNTAIDGNNGKLKEAVKSCLNALLEKSGAGFEQVKCIIASGMITSNVGLVEVPHLVAPVGIDELAEGTKSILIEDVCPLPIYFIPGVKNSGGPVGLDSFESMDIMRGEEAESMAIIEAVDTGGKPLLLVLPGSHTKFVAIDAKERITGCLTTITGELLAAITNDTIIADAVGRKFVEPGSYDQEMILLGYDTAKKTGLGRACFSARILSQFVMKDTDKIANFLLGAALSGDVFAVKNSDALKTNESMTVIVAGKSPLKEAFLDVFGHDGGFGEVISFDPPEGVPPSALGAYTIAGKNSGLKSII